MAVGTHESSLACRIEYDRPRAPTYPIEGSWSSRCRVDRNVGIT
ncbi:hypothetical protein [Natronomonas sp.]